MTLALLGGEPTVTAPLPHNPLSTLSQDDRDAVAGYLNGASPDFEDDGVLHELEAQLAGFHGRRFCLVTNSGTSALHSAYFGLGLGPGDEVIVPTNTFPATVTALLAVGATPVLADCEPDTGNIDPGDVAVRLTDRTKAIVVTHQWGHPVEMDPLLAAARRHGIPLVEDASLAVGATYRGRRAGSFGNAVALSLSASKLIGGGQGGALLADDPEIIDRALVLAQWSRAAREVRAEVYRPYAVTGFGHNYRMHVLAAVVAQARLRRIDELIAQRHSRLSLLTSLLAGQEVVTPPVTRHYVHRGQWGGYLATYHPESAGGLPLPVFASALVAEGLEVSPGGYHHLLHRTALFATGTAGSHVPSTTRALPRYQEGDFPQAEAHADSQLGLPTFLYEPDALIEGYGKAIVKVARNAGQLAAWVGGAPPYSGLAGC